ncbi:Glutathione-regulated potassium-efflux system ancillary protein KefF/G [Olavius algarvensis associated proteobacterium Delta 3]|nr:Glutathione-regulated potassium-efflux system ancillary protein KefF/G [Olavius algarvensis associated proteobacterium Delta 3]CAB5131565.1 Glutathione-regulated potassium-efflux system ancillary protein KefF/G [Olavius algarvensis associated proteobacterium Delta 3]
MKKILVLFAHPAFKRSKMNAALRAAIEDLEGVTFHDLYASYPDFLIDVPREQDLCESHDIIVFQHPFYWYSTPAILKEWMDLVLEHEWAYGSTGNALAGKISFQALTAGGDITNYRAGGMNMFTIRELTTPYRATANLCKIEWLPPFAVLGIHQGLSEEECIQRAEEYRRTLIALRDERLDLDRAKECEFLNQDLDAILKQV